MSDKSKFEEFRAVAKMPKDNPMQPVYRDEQGVVRFKPNKIVRWLLDWASSRGMSLNELALMEFSDEDRQQLAQLIGYSLGGYSELHYVSDESYAQADKLAAELSRQRPIRHER